MKVVMARGACNNSSNMTPCARQWQSITAADVMANQPQSVSLGDFLSNYQALIALYEENDINDSAEIGS